MLIKYLFSVLLNDSFDLTAPSSSAIVEHLESKVIVSFNWHIVEGRLRSTWIKFAPKLFIFMPLTLDQALDDVCWWVLIQLMINSRFIYNLPSTDKNIPHRLLLNVEAALWFYDDHVRPAHESYPPFRLANFCRLMFIRDPLLSQLITQIPQLLEKFSLYKLSIPVAGVILLNPTMSKVT